MAIAVTPPTRADLPTHLDLPCSDDKPVDNLYQPFEAALLSSCLTPWLDQLHPAGDYLLGADNGIYWKITEDPFKGVKAPDWFYVPGVPRLLNGVLRRSYVLWQELVPPLVVMEIISGNSSEEYDTTPGSGKFWVYEQAIRAKYYVILNHLEESFEVYTLTNERYRLVKPNRVGRVRIPEMKIELGLLPGQYLGNPATWLRAWNENGELLLSPEEREEAQKHRAEAEKHRAEAEKQRAEVEKQRADKLAAKLRELGVDPSQL